MSHGILLSLLLLSAGELKDEFYQDFRGRGAMSPGLVFFGPQAKDWMRNDSGGLRMALPAKRKNSGAVGISPRFPHLGDFEITVGYEILAADEPSRAWGRLKLSSARRNSRQ